MVTNLSDSQCAPFVFPQQLQRASRAVHVLLGYDLEHGLGQLDVAVFVVLVRVPNTPR
jgi:hypothetical protein